MKTIKLTIGLCSLALLFASCKDGRENVAKQNIKEYKTYVDSVSNLEYAEAYNNWESIESEYQNYKSLAMVNIDEVKDKEDLREDIDQSFKLKKKEKRKAVL
jgi:hypothetical protein